MTGTKQYLLDVVEIDLGTAEHILRVYINVYDNSLSRKWLSALNHLLQNRYHIEKNYCFFGFADGPRNGEMITASINDSIAEINRADLGYQIDDWFDLSNTIIPGVITGRDGEGGDIDRVKLNQLHRYFEDLQGVSGAMSPYYNRADMATRWHIRQLNLLCHEFESWALSWRKKHTAPEWQRPSQLMCWLNAPRFVLEESDYDLFGIDSMNRPLGGVFVGVNKAIGKHHWEVFVDEAQYNPDFLADNLTTTSLRSQTEAAGDFDIEWANNPANFEWQQQHLINFRKWLILNGLDPDDKTLTIGHPQIGQVDLVRTFGTDDYRKIWQALSTNLNVHAVRTSDASAIYTYHWSDQDYKHQQISALSCPIGE
jgi:hypothetical protein